MWARVTHFSEILQASIRGPLPYDPANNLPFGTAWNTGTSSGGRVSFGRWAATIPGIRLASTIEIPYANASGQAVSAETARAFGHDLARAIYTYLQESE
jgi:hypothetical protein